MLPSDLRTLSTFLIVAEEKNFTRAGRRLGVSPSAISHSMRGLEDELGVRLLARTTRSVALTEAGERLLARLKPAFAEVEETLGLISGETHKPAGRVRLLIPRFAIATVLAPKLARLHEEYPDLVLDVVTDNNRRDIVAEGFDAGIHFGEYIEKDMIVVRVSRDHRPAIVGSPEYLKAHPKPKEPRDLLQHSCINFRHGPTELYRWEFEKGKKELSVAVHGPLITDDADLVLQGAVQGLGLAYVSEHKAAAYLAEGKLLRVLQDWCQPFPGFFMYYPSRRQQTAALTALVKVLRFGR
jgi:DNA-binding transcriptional LysR family regulator